MMWTRPSVSLLLLTLSTSLAFLPSFTIYYPPFCPAHCTFCSFCHIVIYEYTHVLVPVKYVTQKAHTHTYPPTISLFFSPPYFVDHTEDHCMWNVQRPRLLQLLLLPSQLPAFCKNKISFLGKEKPRYRVMHQGFSRFITLVSEITEFTTTPSFSFFKLTSPSKLAKEFSAFPISAPSTKAYTHTLPLLVRVCILERRK